MAGRTRWLSNTELDTALTCQAKHAFQYTGHLTRGRTLKRRSTAPILREGRAWGAAVAAWHAGRQSLTGWAEIAAHTALLDSLKHDEREAAEREAPLDPLAVQEMAENMGGILDHYMRTATPLPNLTMLEGEGDVALPSRTGRGSSSRYRFQFFLDGYTERTPGYWLVEFKLRTSLTPRKLAQRNRQIRQYAWAHGKRLGSSMPVGVLLDERLNQAPKPAKVVRAKRKSEGVDGYTVSHDMQQVTTVESYRQTCERYGVEPQPQVVEALQGREWQRRHPIIFRPGELEEAGRELVSGAELIRDLDSGARFPIRNAKPQNCNRCQFDPICDQPDDDLYIETLFQFSEPKRFKSSRNDDPQEAESNGSASGNG